MPSGIHCAESAQAQAPLAVYIQVISRQKPKL